MRYNIQYSVLNIQYSIFNMRYNIQYSVLSAVMRDVKEVDDAFLNLYISSPFQGHNVSCALTKREYKHVQNLKK